MSIFKLGMGSSSMPGQTKKKARHEAGPEEHLQSVGLKVLSRKPSVYVLPGLILGYAVALLDLAFELPHGGH